MLIGILILFFSCKDSTEGDKTTYFGGKIKNPKESYVYFLQNEKIIDSAKIGNNNRFSFDLEDIETGLYTFKHGPEFQYLYLEPQDSLLIYLNTWDFDESLVFSGKGGNQNNYLIDFFLQQEHTEKKFKQYYSLNEHDFVEKINEEKVSLLAKYDELIELEEEEPTEFFDHLAKAGINYSLYSKLEFYPLKHRDSAHKHDYLDVSNTFYDFRKELNYNEESLFNYRTYTYYLESFFYNKAYQTKKEDPTQNNFSLNFMKAVNENLENEKLKNKYLASGFWGSLKDDLTKEQQTEIQSYFFENCNDEKYLNEAKMAINQCNQLKDGDSLPTILAVNAMGNEIDIQHIAKDKNTVIYFWPKDEGMAELLAAKIPMYKDKYPDVLFIGVKRGSKKDNWDEFILSKKLSQRTQFNMVESYENYSWFDGDMARTLIVDNQGIVKNAYLFFNDSYNLEKNLQKLK